MSMKAGKALTNGSKHTIRTHSPLTLVGKSRSASRDLESYIMRNSTESLKQGPKYNFKEVDRYDESSSSPHRENSKGARKTSKGDQKQSQVKSSSQKEGKKLEKISRQPNHSVLNNKSIHDRSVSNGARLAELCPEDKAKIGELVKKLALETKQKQEYAQKYEQEKAEMARRLKQLEE